jgi:predicted aspartyl protease
MRSRTIAGLLLLVLAGCDQGSGCNLVQVTQVPLEARGRLFAVPVTASGHRLNLLLDTGSERSLLDEAAVRRLSIPQDGRTFSIEVGLGGGSPRADANVEGMLLGDVPLPISRMPVSTVAGVLGVDGILGVDVLRDYDLDLDGPNRTLALYRIRRCDDAAPPWSEPAVRFDDVATGTGLLQVPFEIDGIAAVGTVDTGASVTSITPRLLRRLGVTEQGLANDRSMKLHIVAGEDEQARIHRFRTMRIGPLTLQNVPVLVLTKEPPALGGGRRFSDGLIGQDLLRDRRVWLSIATDRLFMSRNSSDAPATGH